MPNSISESIRDRARAEGFDVVRYARAEAPPLAGERLAFYLADGRHGTMDWLARNAERRADPKELWPEARSVIVLA